MFHDCFLYQAFIPSSEAAEARALHSSSTSSAVVPYPIDILMLDILEEGSTFIAVRTLSALPFEFEEQALPDERQNPLSAIILRKTSDGIGFAQMFMI